MNFKESDVKEVQVDIQVNEMEEHHNIDDDIDFLQWLDVNKLNNIFEDDLILHINGIRN